MVDDEGRVGLPAAVDHLDNDLSDRQPQDEQC